MIALKPAAALAKARQDVPADREWVSGVHQAAAGRHPAARGGLLAHPARRAGRSIWLQARRRRLHVLHAACRWLSVSRWRHFVQLTRVRRVFLRTGRRILRRGAAARLAVVSASPSGPRDGYRRRRQLGNGSRHCLFAPMLAKRYTDGMTCSDFLMIPVVIVLVTFAVARQGSAGTGSSGPRRRLRGGSRQARRLVFLYSVLCHFRRLCRNVQLLQHVLRRSV